MTVQDVITELNKAQEANRLKNKLRSLAKPKVLILDEMGYLPMNLAESNLFFQLVSARYEKGSTILTSNKSYGVWNEIFPDTAIATAILDRLLHHSMTINIRGNSYRLKDKKKVGLFDSIPGVSEPKQNS
jgi:DNA replication protein DnaC